MPRRKKDYEPPFELRKERKKRKRGGGRFSLRPVNDLEKGKKGKKDSLRRPEGRDLR